MLEKNAKSEEEKNVSESPPPPPPPPPPLCSLTFLRTGPITIKIVPPAAGGGGGVYCIFIKIYKLPVNVWIVKEHYSEVLHGNFLNRGWPLSPLFIMIMIKKQLKLF